VPLGYEVGSPQVDPQKVRLRGPRSLVESVSEVVATVWLRGSKTAVESEVAPVALDGERTQVGADVEVSPQTVKVMLPVVPLAEFRDITVKAQVIGSPAAGYWVSNITVEPAAVTIQGKPEVIRSMPAVVSTEPIDVTGVKETVTRRVSLELPEDVSVYSADTSAQTVLVRVEVTPIIGGKTIQPKIEVLGLRSGLTATISPETIDVILSGPMPELQALQVGDVSVVVNLFGLRVGRHMVTPTVVLPEGSGLKVEGMSPEVVEVTIGQASGGRQ
jgi:YbbR domain-containing protein